MRSNEIKEEIDLLTQIIEVDTRIKELDTSKDYINSDYYWKRRNELVEHNKYLLRENIRRFNSEEDKNSPEEPDKYPKIRG